MSAPTLVKTEFQNTAGAVGSVNRLNQAHAQEHVKKIRFDLFASTLVACSLKF